VKTVTAIYTGQALVQPLSAYFAITYPDYNLVNILDDSLIKSVIQSGEMTKEVLRKIYSICREAQASGSDMILQTCSSVGKSADLIQPFLDIPILRIDQPMVEHAVRDFPRIAVLATLSTTLEPTIDLIRIYAEKQGKNVEIVNGLAIGAFQALSNGNVEEHDRKIMEIAETLADQCDVFVLAQGSMARMKKDLEVLGCPVLTSLESGVDALRSYLEGIQ
jgi:aspartate/glutamate racemase